MVADRGFPGAGARSGRELFDLPDAPRPDPRTPAPVRFVGEFDNVTLGHADRRREIGDDFPRAALARVGRAVNQVLVDGMRRATWWIEHDPAIPVRLVVRVFGEISSDEGDEGDEREGRRIAAVATGSDGASVELVG